MFKYMLLQFILYKFDYLKYLTLYMSVLDDKYADKCYNLNIIMLIIFFIVALN